MADHGAHKWLTSGSHTSSSAEGLPSIRRMSSYTVLPKTFTTNGWTTRLKKNPGSAYGFGSVALELTTTSRRTWKDWYLHWSFIDNFEWSDGYSTTFGLVPVDRATFERTPKAGALHLR